MNRGPAVLVEDVNAVRILTLNRPERRNALDLEDRRELIAALDEAQAANGCRAIVVTGAGRFFCAGGDIASMSQDPAVARVRLSVVNDIARALIGSSKPVVAAIEGGAFGLGLSIVAACDFLIASEDSRFAASFGRLGLIADTGLFWSLSQRVGPGRAKEMILLGSEVTAPEARRIGLVSDVVEPGAVMARAMSCAEDLAQFSPGSLAGAKSIFAQAGQDLESVLLSEYEIQVHLLGTEAFTEGREAFLARRAPRFHP